MTAAGVEQILNSVNICEKYSKRIDGYQCKCLQSAMLLHHCLVDFKLSVNMYTYMTCSHFSYCTEKRISPILVPTGVFDEVAVLVYVLAVIGLACDRHMNLAPDGLIPKPIESSGGFPPLRNTKYT